MRPAKVDLDRFTLCSAGTSDYTVPTVMLYESNE